jgi:hypothetical protein
LYGAPKTEYQYFSQKVYSLSSQLSSNGGKYKDAALASMLAEDDDDLQELRNEKAEKEIVEEDLEFSYQMRRQAYYEEYPFGSYEW